MSEFLAEARILVRPDTTRFRATLEAELAAATKKPVVVPVTAAFVGGTGSLQAFAGAQGEAATATLGLDRSLEFQNQLLAQNAHILGVVTEEEQVAAGAKASMIAATLRQSEATAGLARIQALSAKGAQTLASAELAAVTATSERAAAQSRASAAVRAAAVQEEALQLALARGNVELIRAAVATTVLTRAHAEQAIAALAAARAETIEAAAAAESSAAHAQATRGIVAETLALAGLRGATLAASAPFLLGATGAIILAKSVREASDATEEFNKTGEVFGERAEQIRSFAETTATSLGISNVEALKAAGVFGNLFRSIQIGQEPAAQMSQRLVELAADLASFNNADPSQVLDALRSGLVGQARPLRVFGIFISQARAQQQALIDTQKKSVKELTNAELVQARYNIILRDSTLAQGDFERTQGRLANQTRILKAQLADLEGEIGRALIPSLTTAIGLANDYVAVFGNAARQTANFASKIPLIGDNSNDAEKKARGLLGQVAGLAIRFQVLGPVVGAASLALKHFGDTADDQVPVLDFFQNKLKGLAADFAAIAARTASKPLSNLTAQLNALEVARLKIQTSGGGQAAEEANLREQIALDQKLVDTAKSGSAARRRALEELQSDQQELAQLQQQTADAAKKSADATKARAEDALRAQQEADQALLDLLSQRRADADRRAAAAAATEGLQDDIRAQDRIQALIRAQIQRIKAQVKSQEARRDALRELRIALIASRAEEDALRKQQAESAAARKDEIQNLNIEIADERGNQNALARAIQIRINTLNKQIKAARGDQVKMKQLILERERLKNQLEEARKQQDDINKQQKTAAQKQFEFMQSLQGFSANLLGNLIPGFATGGLVGNTSSGPAAGAAFQDLGAGVKTSASLAGSVGATVKPVQVDTTNALLRQIIAILGGKNVKSGPPETVYNRYVATSLLDIY